MSFRAILCAGLVVAIRLYGQMPAHNYREVRNCATCHPAQAKFHPETSMAQAKKTITECAILQKHPKLTAKIERYSYRIERRGEQSIYTVTDGAETFTAP